MVIHRQRAESAWLSIDMAVALGLLLLVALPLAWSFSHEQQLARLYYWQAISMEIIDGEMEILRAGEWRRWEPGTHPYPVTAFSAANLPPGQFALTRGNNFVRLEWIPARRHSGSRMMREAKL